MATETYYTPGVCNINPAEVKARRRTGHFGVIATILTAAGLLIFKAPLALGGILFLPIWIAATGYLQAKNKFCVTYGAEGMFNSSPKLRDTSKSTNEADLKLDQARTRKINTQAFLIGVIGTVVVFVLLTAI